MATGETNVAAAAAAAADAENNEDGGLLEQLTEGTVVDGKYRIDQIIGRGAMGVVASATHLHLRERVALKFLYVKTNTSTEDFHSRFRREAQVSAKMRNEHITRVIDVGVWREKAPFMVMDYLEGRDLRQTLKAHNGPLPIATVMDYMVQVCEGMAEAHSFGIVHRDLKPSNLFVTTRPDGTDLIKILDFGISKWSADESEMEELTQTGVVLGSPKYMSPEQLFGSSAVDSRADIWSIGAIFYELLAGKPPYNEPTLARICAELASDKPPPSLRALNPDIPPALEEAIFSCFARDRDLRMPNVAELAGAALDAIGAPFAGNVRSKIGAMLDPKGTRDGLSATSGGGFLGGVSGAYGPMSMSGSQALTGTGRTSKTGTGPTLQAVIPSTDIRISTPPPDKASRVPLIAATVAAILFAGIAVGGYFGKGHESAPAAAVAPPVVAPIPTVAPTPAPVPEAPAAPSVAAATTAASAAAAAPPPTAPAPAPRSYGGYRAPSPAPRAATPTTGTPSQTVVAAPPQTTPPPTPTPAAPLAEPTKKPKVNPLEDRQ